MFKIYDGSVYGKFYRTETFSEIWSGVSDFLSDYNTNGLPVTISQESARTLFYLLYSRFGNSNVSSSDQNRFKYQLFSTIWQYGPTWEKKLEVQQKLRDLSDEELFEGSKSIYNVAVNPSTAPGTYSDEELTFISQQNVNKNKKGKLDAYYLLWELLKNDVTEDFLKKFNKLFKVFVEPELPLFYEEEN